MYGEDDVENMTKSILFSCYKDNKILFLLRIFTTCLSSIYIVVIVTALIKSITENIISLNYDTTIHEIVLMFIFTLLYILVSGVDEFLSYLLRKKSSFRLEDSILLNFVQYDEWNNFNCGGTAWTKLTKDVPLVVEGELSVIFRIISISTTILFGAIYAICINLICTLICIISITIVFLCMKNNYIMMPKWQKTARKTSNGLYGYLMNIIENGDILRYVHMPRVYRYYNQEANSHIDSIQKKGRCLAKVLVSKNIATTGVVVFISAVLAVMSYFHIGILSVGKVMALFLVIPKISVNILALFDWYSDYQFLEANISQLDELFHHNLYDSKNKVQINSIDNVSLNNISITYEECQLFSGLNFTAEKKNMIGIIGTSGSGKTSLMNTLLFLNLNYQGSILINQMNMKEIDRLSFWRHCVYLSQDAYIFNGSIKDNIVMNQSYHSERMIEALKAALFFDFVEKQPMGLDTNLSEINMSSGEKQRLCIARALYKQDVDLLLFDEATSAIDKDSEKIILANVKEICTNQNKIVFWITHNHALLSEFQQVIDLNSYTKASESTVCC